MSAQPEQPADNLVSIEINGKPLQAAKGSMIIQAADKAGIAIPRFCYHEKLTIAANCRMCLVDVETNGKPAPKPQPACSTPVGEGMKIATQSGRALSAQRNVMEFLLINHPLDCPVCDQGGECELQDLALGFGRGVSRFTERKRAVADEDIGPLIATYMTRCIHCTRCVRFLREMAGTNELGCMGRAEALEIGTYIGKSIESEVGGNIIDLCPVGALTNKPFEFRARAWELIAKPSIGYHDALGSNLWLHTRRGEVLRTVPRDNESINECWLSDRDRYSHEGLYAADRLLRPRVKRNGQWQECDWNQALKAASDVLANVAGDDLGILAHPAISNEEGALLKRLADALGSPHLDHRLRQLDFADNATARPFEMSVEAFDKLDAGLIVGSDTRGEMPLLHLRLRQASIGARKHAGSANRTRFDVTTLKGAALHVVNPARFSFNYDLASETVVATQSLVDTLLGLAAAVVETGATPPEGALGDALAQAQVTETARASIKDLRAGESSVVLLGEVAAQHPQASWLRAITRFIAQATGAKFAEMPMGANAIGLAQQGVFPAAKGLNASAMLSQQRKNYLLYGVEPPYDFADGAQALKAFKEADKVVAFSAYASSALLDVADVLLPLAMLPESDVTTVNVNAVSQQLAAGSSAPGDARQGWKILRALGGMMELSGFTFASLVQLRESMRDTKVADVGQPALAGRAASTGGEGLVRLATTPIYRWDAVVRRAQALNMHPLNRGPAIRLHADDAGRLGLEDGAMAKVEDVSLPVVVDADVPAGCAWIETAYDQTATLPPYGATLNVSKA